MTTSDELTTTEVTETPEVPAPEDTPTEQPPEAPAPPAPPSTPEPPKVFREVIQPVDDSGNPIGSPHVYEASTEAELRAKMALGIANGTKKINQLTRQLKIEKPKPLEGAEQAATTNTPAWQPRELTEDEKFLVKTDPEKAFELQFKSKFGMTTEEFRTRQQHLDENSKVLREKAETEMFLEEHPEYLVCPHNQDAIIGYIVKHNLAWRKKNLDIAYADLSESGLLKARTPVIPEVSPVPVAPANQPSTPPTEARTEPPVARSDFPSVIRNSSTRAVAPIRKKSGEPTAEEIASMSAEEYQALHPELHQAR